jgi:glucuronoarabinoxylan endo-1,4-beta-xylanase
VGYCGTILRTINGGVAWAENKPDKIPVGFSLVQNYPNPFNPSTNIRIELPQASQVSLRVYDMLGREVSELVNERRDAGVHEVKFDGSELSSGVYLYRLQAGSFTQTRKLLLVR